MFAAALALAAMTMGNPAAPVEGEVQELRAGCHPYRAKTPACDNAAAGKHLADKEAVEMACHPDPVKSRICRARERETGATLAMFGSAAVSSN